MSEPAQLFNASLAKDAVYKTGLRSFMEYRDLGIERATHGKFRAHVIRIKRDAESHDLHTTGLHQHRCDFQMFYVLKGWIRFVYEGQGEHTFNEGDCVLQPAGIVHLDGNIVFPHLDIRRGPLDASRGSLDGHPGWCSCEGEGQRLARVGIGGLDIVHVRLLWRSREQGR